MWNIDTDTTVNPLKALDSGDIVRKLGSSLVDHPLIAIFMQDELSVEDFKSGELSAVRATAELESDGTFYHPSVSNTENLPHSFEDAGYTLIKVKSHQDLPKTSVSQNTVLVIELPITQTGDSRSDNLQLNANAIANVYEVLKSQQPNVVGVFTATKNSKENVMEPHKRTARALSAPLKPKNVDLFINVTGGLFLFLENPPSLKLQNEKGSELFVLDQNPVSSDSTAGGENPQLVLSYSNIAGTNETTSMLKKATFTFTFAKRAGYWFIRNSSIDFDSTLNGNTWAETQELKSADIFTPHGFSYHCTPKLVLSRNMKNSQNNKTVVFQMNGFQLQPFLDSRKDKFGDWYDCQGFFTEAIWAAIFLGLVIAAVLAWAISMLADVKGPDRFDDPKGKSITVSNAE